MSEPVSGESVDDSVGVAKLVVKERTNNAGRQCVTDIPDTLTHVIPNVGHLLRPCRLFQINEDRRHSRTGVAANKIQAGRFLKRAFESLGDLLNGILNGRAWPGRRDHHRLNDKGWVLVAAESVEGDQARNDRRHHEIDDERAMLERPFREIDHDACATKRTFWPGWRACTPAVTTISPVSRPWEITTVPGS